MNIAFVGKAGSGKDFAASYLVSNFAYQRVAFADELKVEAYEALPGVRVNHSFREEAIQWINERKHLPWMRSFLQSLGVAKREAVDPLYWVQVAFTHIATTERWSGPQSWVVTDCRFQNEADTLREAGFYLVRIHRLDQEPLSGDLGSHASETEQEDIQEDYGFYNPGTPDKLYHELDLMIQYLGDLERVRGV